MKKSVVIGAGVIGLATGYELAKRGRTVVLIDPGQPGEACTKGNAGWITPSISAPIPAPGLTWTSLKWMLRSDSPLYIAPSAVPGLARWLWRFWRFCNGRDFERGLHAVAELNRPTMALYDRLEREGVRFELHRQGLAFTFLTDAYMRAALADFGHYQQYGYRIPTVRTGAEMRTLEPALSEAISCGFVVEEEYHVRPETLAAGYVAKLGEQGATLRIGAGVKGFSHQHGRVQAVITDAGEESADEVLIAAGAWTGQVTDLLGVSLPVQAGKGYSITVQGDGPTLQRPVYLGEARVGCSPFQGAVRFAGTMELSGVNTVLDRRRVVGIRKGISRYFKNPVPPTAGTEWVGMRPLTPDGLPMLGRVPGYSNAYVATGHAMLGVTLAPATGEVMADLMVSGAPAPVLAPFEPGRFRW
jgi:D-amino-acid dehydrogenase